MSEVGEAIERERDVLASELDTAKDILRSLALYTGPYHAKQLTTEQRFYMFELTGYGEFEVWHDVS